LKECESFKENEFFCCASSAIEKNNWRPFPLWQSSEFDFAGKRATVPVLRPGNCVSALSHVATQGLTAQAASSILTMVMSSFFCQPGFCCRSCSCCKRVRAGIEA
jgi:hypothetical protein